MTEELNRYADLTPAELDPSRSLDADLVGSLLVLLADADDVADLFDELVFLAVHHVPLTSSASITVMRDEGPVTAAATDDQAVRMDQVQYAVHHGPCLTAAATGEFCQIPLINEESGSEWVAAAAATGLHSVLSVPLVSAHEVAGSLNLYGNRPHRPAWPTRSVALAETLAAYAAEAIAILERLQDLSEHNRRLITEFERIQVVDQAIGVIMGQRRCTPDHAHALLLASARAAGVSIGQCAQRLIGQVSRNT